jgi:hypothetical protein
MANKTGHLHWAIDTIPVDASSAAIPLATDKLRVQKLTYVPTSSSANITLQTYNHVEKAWEDCWNETAGGKATLFMDFGSQGHDFHGLKLTNMGVASASTTGVLYVYFK